jgi:hypothetical protein
LFSYRQILLKQLQLRHEEFAHVSQNKLVKPQSIVDCTIRIMNLRLA